MTHSRLQLVAAIVLCAALTGCIGPADLENPQTAAVATCWNPLLEFPLYAAIAPTDDQDCAHHYFERGYERVPDDGAGT